MKKSALEKPNITLTSQMMQCLNRVCSKNPETGKGANRSEFIEGILRQNSLIRAAAEQLGIVFIDRPREGSQKRIDPLFDAKVFDAWNSGKYKTMAELGKRLKISQSQVWRATHRHATRQAERNVKS